MYQHLSLSAPPGRPRLPFCSLQQQGDLFSRLRECASWQQLRTLLNGLEASGELQQLAASLLPAEEAAAAAAAEEQAAEQQQQQRQQQAAQQEQGAEQQQVAQQERARFVGISVKQGCVYAASYMPLDLAGRLAGAPPSLWPAACARGLVSASAQPNSGTGVLLCQRWQLPSPPAFHSSAQPNLPAPFPLTCTHGGLLLP